MLHSSQWPSRYVLVAFLTLNSMFYVLLFVLLFFFIEYCILFCFFCCLYHWNDACTSLVKRSQQFQDRVICWHETFEHVSQFIVVRLKFVCIFARIILYFVIFTSMSSFICIFSVVWLLIFLGLRLMRFLAWVFLLLDFCKINAQFIKSNLT